MSSQKRKSGRFYRYAAYGLLAALFFVIVGAGGALAWMKWQGSEVANVFTAEVQRNPEVVETFDGKRKSDVKINVGNTGAYSVYVRADVVVNWMNESGGVLSSVPVEGRDYSMEWNLEEHEWFRGGDGFYYYASPVESGQDTGVLIKSCTQTAEPPESGYSLQVKIMSQTIQAAGFTDREDMPAVQDAWGIRVNEDGTLQKP